MLTSLTLFYPSPLTGLLLQKVEDLFTKLGIHATKTLLAERPNLFVSRWYWHTGALISVSEQAQQLQDLENTLRTTLSLGSKEKFDLVIRQGELKPAIKLAVFDMDSTLIQAEVMDEVAKRAGIGDKIAAITARAMAGKIDFTQSFQQRLSLLRGFPEDQLDAIYQSIELMSGAQRLIQNLTHQGVHCVIISGGFTYFSERFTKRLGMQDAYANVLDIQDGKLTGQFKPPIVDGERKLTLLQQLCEQHEWALDETLAVGDGANDLPMLGGAGIGVAFHAKPVVQAQAPHCIQNFGLDALLYGLGWQDSELI